MCLYPNIIKNKKYTANKKNGGNIPTPTDKRVLYVPVKCGKCMECAKQKSREWQVRLNEDIKHNKNAQFVTLTFSNEEYTKLSKEITKLDGYERDNEIAKKAVRRFCEKWRKKNGKSIRHWLITELGHQGTENIHMHGILWTDKPEEIAERWRYGFIWIGTWVNEATIGYITKYVTKTDEKHKEYIPKIYCSAGLGKEYTESFNATQNKYKEKNTREQYITQNGKKIGLPIYYRNQIYTEEEREKLWIQKLDKNERWIGGEKIKADDEKNINALLKHYRTINNRLGYGDNTINWERRIYEREIRNINHLTRLKNKK